MDDQNTHTHDHAPSEISPLEAKIENSETYFEHMKDFCRERFSRTILVPELATMAWGAVAGGIATYILDAMNVSPLYEATGSNVADLAGHTAIYSVGLYKGMKDRFYTDDEHFRRGAFLLFLSGMLLSHEVVDGVIYAARTGVSYEVLTNSDNSFYMWTSSVGAGLAAHMGLMTAAVGTLSYVKERYEQRGKKAPGILSKLLDKLDHDHTHMHDDPHTDYLTDRTPE